MAVTGTKSTSKIYLEHLVSINVLEFGRDVIALSSH